MSDAFNEAGTERSAGMNPNYFNWSEEEERACPVVLRYAVENIARQVRFAMNGHEAWQVTYAHWAAWMYSRSTVDNQARMALGYLKYATSATDFARRLTILHTKSVNEMAKLTVAKEQEGHWWDSDFWMNQVWSDRYSSRTKTKKKIRISLCEIASSSYRRMLQAVVSEGHSTGDPNLDQLLLTQEYPTVWHCPICGDHATACDHTDEIEVGEQLPGEEPV